MNAQKQLIIPVIDIENRIKELLGDGDTSFVYADDEYLQEHNPEVLELKKLLVNDSYGFTIRQSVDFCRSAKQQI